MTEIDEAFAQTRKGNHAGFATWVGLCTPSLRRSLRRFARTVDVEAVLQEGLLRMWVLAPGLHLEGEDASLRYALRLVHNVSVSEARRLQVVSPEELEVLDALPTLQTVRDPPVDPALEKAILRCIRDLPRKPAQALAARLRGGDDRQTASQLGVRLNTFLQNVVRARRLLARCLQTVGIDLKTYGTR